jgi:hypothetical protein
MRRQKWALDAEPFRQWSSQKKRDQNRKNQAPNLGNERTVQTSPMVLAVLTELLGSHDLSTKRRLNFGFRGHLGKGEFN